MGVPTGAPSSWGCLDVKIVRQGSRRLAGPGTVFNSLHSHWPLVYALTRRSVLTRYRGAFLGLFWSLATPLIRLAVYTFVFGTVIGVRWPNQEGGTLDFAALLFAGLICHSFAAEIMTQSGTLLLTNRQYVKKVIFPLESLPWVVVLAAIFQLAMSTIVLIAYVLFLDRELSWTVVFLPLLFAALALMMLAAAWMISATAVFVRDITQVIELMTMVLLFLSPVFFPISALPDALQPFIYLNPITFIVEQVRVVLLLGEMPDFFGLGIYAMIAFFICWLSVSWFRHLRPGFSDVI